MSKDIMEARKLAELKRLIQQKECEIAQTEKELKSRLKSKFFCL